MKRKASETTEIKKVQRKLHRRLQKEFNWKIRITKKYLDDVGKEDLEKLEKSYKNKMNYDSINNDK